MLYRFMKLRRALQIREFSNAVLFYQLRRALQIREFSNAVPFYEIAP